MTKIKINPKYAPFPKPIALIGSNVNNKPNFMTIAWFNRMAMVPNYWMVAINKNHHTFQGIKMNKTFSMNFPDPNLVKETDFCGLISGKEFDKSALFTIYYGELKNAPLIEECPIAIELKVIDIIEREDQMLLIGEVVNIFSEEKYMTKGELDPQKCQPLAFMKPNPEGYYYSLSKRIAKAWSIGKELEKKE